ncbi:hypothetical protein FXO38_14259 [Capsicum annuum]|nr:hypothetical protein FXO38_14259 [Capsicum annuum]KAF3658333.1 hypothetical protein FXO37_14458 [Capsicum annuum]
MISDATRKKGLPPWDFAEKKVARKRAVGFIFKEVARKMISIEISLIMKDDATSGLVVPKPDPDAQKHDVNAAQEHEITGFKEGFNATVVLQEQGYQLIDQCKRTRGPTNSYSQETNLKCKCCSESIRVRSEGLTVDLVDRQVLGRLSSVLSSQVVHQFPDRPSLQPSCRGRMFQLWNSSDGQSGGPLGDLMDCQIDCHRPRSANFSFFKRAF